MKIASIALLVIGFALIGVSFVMPRATQQVNEEQLAEFDEMVLAVHTASVEGTQEGREKAKRERERAQKMHAAWEAEKAQREQRTKIVRIAGLVLAVAGGGVHLATRES